MAHIIEIEHLADAALSVYTSLTQPQQREKGLFIAESVNVISHALDAGYEPVSFLLSKKHAFGKAASLLVRADNIPAYVAEEEVLEKITGYALTRGVLCAMRRKPFPDAEDICRDARIVCAIHAVTDATNVGAIIRSAAALGGDCVLLSNCCDPFSRRSVRVSMGTVFQVPIAQIHGDCAEFLRKMGFATAALTLTDDSVLPNDPRLKSEEKIALILSAEGDGLPQEIVEKCDYRVKIPMARGVDSLNVAAAAAVALYAIRE